MLELLRTRRSIRKFSPEPLAAETVAALKEAVLRSPSSRGINPWTFHFVQDPALIAQLAGCKEHGSSFLKGAPLAVAVCGDEGASDVWIEDCSIAAIILHLTAASLGLGSCWVQVRNRTQAGGASSEEVVRALLGIATPLRVLAIVAIGHPAEIKAGHPLEKLDHGKVVG
jgi:nitroreductase